MMLNLANPRVMSKLYMIKAISRGFQSTKLTNQQLHAHPHITPKMHQAQVERKHHLLQKVLCRKYGDHFLAVIAVNKGKVVIESKDIENIHAVAIITEDLTQVTAIKMDNNVSAREATAKVTIILDVAQEEEEAPRIPQAHRVLSAISKTTKYLDSWEQSP